MKGKFIAMHALDTTSLCTLKSSIPTRQVGFQIQTILVKPLRYRIKLGI